MKKLLLLLFLFGNVSFLSAQKRAYGSGEYFKFRVHYGFVTAGYATLQVKNSSINGKDVFHVRGSNNHGVWNEQGASIRLRITPPPWKTW